MKKEITNTELNNIFDKLLKTGFQDLPVKYNYEIYTFNHKRKNIQEKFNFIVSFFEKIKNSDKVSDEIKIMCNLAENYERPILFNPPEIVRLATKFVTDHWDNIDKINCEILQSKASFLHTIKDNLKSSTNKVSIAGWVVSELMVWATSEVRNGRKFDFQKQYRVENDNDLIILKIGKKYFKYLHQNTSENIESFTFVEIKPKYKRVLYFE